MKNITLLLLIFLSISIQAQTIYTDTIKGSREYLRRSNEAILEIKFADGNSSLLIKKPLIVVEDFDSGLMGRENNTNADTQ